MSKFQAVIFDMDGTLLDSESFAFKVWKQAMAEFGFDLSHEVFVSMVGTSSSRSKAILLETYGNTLEIDSIRERKVALEMELVQKEKIDVRTGGIDLLQHLKLSNIPYGLATSSERFRAVARLKSAGVLEDFPHILGGDEVMNQKPDPEIFLKMSDLLGVPINNTIVIEDSTSGIEGALRAGAHVCWFRDMAELREDLKSQVRSIESLKEVINLL